MDLTLIDKDNTLERTSTDPPMTNAQATHSYLSYAPKPSIKYPCKSHFFDKLGFKPADISENMRTAFSCDMKAHLDSPSHKFLTRAANPEAFKIVISEFLAEYGPIYWGDSMRDHLQESDSLKGFLCPRDAQRVPSRLVTVVEAFFNSKAMMIVTDARRSIANRTNKHIDFAALTGRKVHLGAIESSNSNKRSAALRESEGGEVDNENSLNWSERMETPKRHRPLPDSEELTQQRQTLDDDPADTYGRKASRKPLLSQRRASSTRRSAFSIASAKINKDLKRANLSHFSRSGEPSDTATVGPFKTHYPHDLTRPPTSTPESNPSNADIFILSDESDAGEEQRKKKPATTPLSISKEENRVSVTEIASGFEDVKTEALTEDMMKKTMFLVTVHGSPIGPVPVPFTECGNFHIFFPTLIEERGVPDEDVKKIDNITTIFTWTGGDFGGRVGGIRRNKPGDWVYFCDSLRKAHEKDADRFLGKCEVAIKLHFNDKYKERC